MIMFVITPRSRDLRSPAFRSPSSKWPVIYISTGSQSWIDLTPPVSLAPVYFVQ